MHDKEINMKDQLDTVDYGVLNEAEMQKHYDATYINGVAKKVPTAAEIEMEKKNKPVAKYSLSKYFFSHVKAKLEYVYDIWGFKKGVVVAIGKNKVGWSLVNLDEDVTYHRIKDPLCLPAIQRMLKDKIPLHQIIKSKPYKSALARGLMVPIPSFDKEEGLNKALNRALAGSLVASYNKIAEEVTLVSGFPYDKDMLEAIDRMVYRSQYTKF